jgi:hypothetical protein
MCQSFKPVADAEQPEASRLGTVTHRITNLVHHARLPVTTGVHHALTHRSAVICLAVTVCAAVVMVLGGSLL